MSVDRFVARNPLLHIASTVSNHLKRHNLRLLAILLTTLLLEHFCLGQTVSPDLKVDSISFESLSDSLIKCEIASFTFKGASLKKTTSVHSVELTEIPVRNCTDKEAELWWSTITSSVSTFIHFYFKGEISNKTLDSISVVTHSHFLVKFPENAFQGLIQANSCNFSGNGKKDKFFSPYFKAFYSEDKKRLYIYMLGGTDSNKYEVTWVIINDKYYTRLIDRIP